MTTKPRGDDYLYIVPSFGTEATLIRASRENTPLPAVNLPVISSAFGNSLSFAWKYEDNYSAGAISQYAEGGIDGKDENKVTGYFQNNYQYTDYYGRAYYYQFGFARSGNAD